jgi:hypothetical protein
MSVVPWNVSEHTTTCFLAKGLHDFPQILQANTGMEIKTSHHCSSPHFFRLMNHTRCSRWFLARGFSTLKMEAILSSEMSVHTRSTLCHVSEDGIIHTHFLLVAYITYIKPWKWRQYFPPKRRWACTGLHGITSQKIKHSSVSCCLYVDIDDCVIFDSVSCMLFPDITVGWESKWLKLEVEEMWERSRHWIWAVRYLIARFHIVFIWSST